MIFDSKGSIMIYAAILAAVLSGGAYLTMKITQDTKKQRNKIIINYEANQVLYDIGMHFIKASTCVETLEFNYGTTATSALADRDITQIRSLPEIDATSSSPDPVAPLTIYEIGNEFGDGSRRIRISGMRISNYNDVAGTMLLTIDFMALGSNILGSSQNSYDMTLTVVRREGNVVACYSDRGALQDALLRICQNGLGGQFDTNNNACLNPEDTSETVHEYWVRRTTQDFCLGLNQGVDNAQALSWSSGWTSTMGPDWSTLFPQTYRWSTTDERCEKKTQSPLGASPSVAQVGPIYTIFKGFGRDGSLIQCSADCSVNNDTPPLPRNKICSSTFYAPNVTGSSECNAIGIQCQGACTSCILGCNIVWEPGSPPRPRVECSLDNSSC